jgi:hypothetical protein
MRNPCIGDFALSAKEIFDDEHVRNAETKIKHERTSDESIDEVIGSQALTQQVLRSDRAI